MTMCDVMSRRRVKSSHFAHHTLWMDILSFSLNVLNKNNFNSNDFLAFKGNACFKKDESSSY